MTIVQSWLDSDVRTQVVKRHLPLAQHLNLTFPWVLLMKAKLRINLIAVASLP